MTVLELNVSAAPFLNSCSLTHTDVGLALKPFRNRSVCVMQSPKHHTEVLPHDLLTPDAIPFVHDEAQC